jgi:hypothetical protein
MATLVPISQLTQYPCNTQEEQDPSYGPAPISNLAGTTGDNAPDEPDSLVVGYGMIVPRWDVNIPGGRKLQYFVSTDTFPDASKAQFAAKAFQDAANSWNELELGIALFETSDQASANFYLVYKVNPPSNRGTLAQAFFPHEIGEDVIVFSRAFAADGVPILKNIFQHEIGHILGLRHEFAITGDDMGHEAEGDGPVQFLQNNPRSIMSYNFPPKLQHSDQEQIIEFYKLANGYMVNNSPVTDYQPQVRRRNR